VAGAWVMGSQAASAAALISAARRVSMSFVMPNN